MDFFSDPRLLQSKSSQIPTTTTTTTTTTTNIKVKTYKSSNPPTIQSTSSNSNIKLKSTSKPTSTSINPIPSKNQIKKRKTHQPIERPIKKAKWNGSKSHSSKSNLLSNHLEIHDQQSYSSLPSDDQSESVFDLNNSNEGDQEEEEEENQEENQILDRYNRLIPRNVHLTLTGFSSTHSLLSKSNPISSILSADQLVKQNRARFRHWFTPGEGHWPFKDSEDPKISLVYPIGGEELFPLLVPKDKDDEYRPLDDILNVITITLGQYLTAEQSIQFFSEPHPIFAPSSNATNPKHDFRFLNHRASSTKPSRSSSVQTGTHESSPLRHDLILRSDEVDLSQVPLIKSLSKSIRRQNGSDFIKLVNWYNRVIKHLISKGFIQSQIQEMKGLKMNIWEMILGQAYERRIGPKIEMVKEYETWSSNVYGELKPKFVSDLVHLVGLKPGQVFVDLGSGVGNIVMQVVLETGCVGVGFENMSSCCQLADEQMKEVIGRCQKYWGVSLGQPLLIEADFTKDPRVGEWLKQADVVLVNNQVFTPSLNESLTLLFLDLKDSTKIISLKPFVPKEFKISERNMNSPLSILNQAQEFTYGSTSVSWTDNGGKFYVTEVNRSRLIEFQKSLIGSGRN
ncbi:histone methylation protein DOT1-domain-containing protein [Melampsora americana]|nr:histone methylation protein DOT1-domain-containing protein [Melampsora americana]